MFFGPNEKNSATAGGSELANIETGFIESNVNFTTASGWLERLVRCLRWLTSRTRELHFAATLANADHVLCDV
jgi:hypothetical protein